MVKTGRELFALLFGFERPVGRRTYALVGFSLMVLKLGVDLFLLYQVSGRLWHPLEYMSLATLSREIPMGTVQAMMLWALPFAWIGLSMSVRRARDAGLSPWVGLLFCLPLVNLLLMLGLCLPPSREPRLRAAGGEPQPGGSALQAVGPALLVALLMLVVSVLAVQGMGAVFFVGTPLAMGVVAGYNFNRHMRRSKSATVAVALSTLAATAGILLLFAFEGLICLVMTLPLAVPLVILGAHFGRSVALGPTVQTSPLLMILLILPLASWAEPSLRGERLHRVTSQVHIAASPQEVWDHVVAFDPLPPPEELWFRLGIAYPMRARIEGEGVGAIRYCEFSTGAFVEPITTWDKPNVLAFEVTHQPDPLRELSPYPRVYADHRQGTVASRRGEFRLLPDPAGGTILEGNTWYELSLFPESYWALWSDAMIRAIHLRVLEHIRTEAEARRRSATMPSTENSENPEMGVGSPSARRVLSSSLGL